MRYAKTIIAVLAAAVITAQAAVTDDVITTAEWIGIGVAAIGALGVYFVKNADVSKPE